MKKLSHLTRTSLLLFFLFGLDKVLAFGRMFIVSRIFSLPLQDSYNSANNLPDLLFALISGGAFSMAFIPLLRQSITLHGRDDAWDLFSRVANLMFVVTGMVAALVALFADQIVSSQIGIAPGFGPEQRRLVADLMRLNLVSLLIFSLSGLVMGGLQANQHFLLPALAPPMYDLGTLFGVLILVPETGHQLGPITLPAFGLGVHGLVYGTVLGAALFLLVQVPGLFHYHFHWKPVIDLHHPGVQKVLVLLGPRVVTVFCIQLTYLAQDNIASRLAAGTVSALVYGWLFMQVPETLIGTAIGTALLPTLSEQLVRGEREAFRQSLSRTLRVILALTLPSAILLGLTLRPVIQILGFDQTGTDLVLLTAQVYLLGLTGHAVLEVVVRAFYAQQDARTPLATAALTTATFITLAVILAIPLGAPGIALANTIAFTGQALLLLYLLSRRFPGFLHLNGTPWRVAVACTISAGLVWALLRLPLPALPLAAVALAAGGLVVLPFIWPELKILMRL